MSHLWQRQLIRSLEIGLALIFAHSAMAQVFTYLQSVDALVADGDQVVEGKIADVSPETHHELGWVLHPVVISVEETLRGVPSPRLQVNLFQVPLDHWPG